MARSGWDDEAFFLMKGEGRFSSSSMFQRGAAVEVIEGMF